MQVGDTRLLAMFFDEPAHDNKPSCTDSFVPNLFVQIGSMEPELRLRTVDYDDAARLLDKSHDEKTPDNGNGAEQFGVFHRD